MTKNDPLNQLAIVITAHKAHFLCQGPRINSPADRQTIYSLRCGDASPDNIKEISDNFTDRLDLVYTRYNDNLGHKSLVQQ